MSSFLFVTHQLSRTGAPIVFLDMMRVLKEEGHTISVISLLPGPLSEELDSLNIPITIKDDFYKDKEAFRVYGETFDAIFCNTLITYQVILAMEGSSTPVIWWIHEGEQYFEYFKTVLPDFSKLKDNIHVYSVGHYVQDVILRRYGVRTPILHFGIRDVKSEITSEIPLQDDLISEDKVSFIISGTYSKVKGQDVLAEAVRLLSKDVLKKCEFLFCGNEDTVDADVFGSVCQLEREFSNVRRLGALPREKMLSVMKEGDYLLVPSRVDPIPTVAAEAMMLYKPCVITDACGIAHYLLDGDNALVCATDDGPALAKKIAEAVLLKSDHVAYERMCRESNKVYEKHFSMDVFVPNVLQLIPGSAGKLIFPVGVYDILDIFTYAMIPKFKELGYEVLVFDTSDMMTALGKLYSFVQEKVTACITFNNLAVNTELTPNQNLWTTLDIPVINILMDHPFAHKKALDEAPMGTIVLCPDGNHMRYLQRFYPKFSTVGFLPHGGNLPIHSIKPLKERSIDILYAGGISRKFAYEMMPDLSKYSFDAKAIGEKAYEDLKRNPSMTTEQALETCLNQQNVFMTEEELCTFFEEMHYVDLLIVSYFREATIRCLAEAGLSIVLYGTGWEVCDWIDACPTLDYRGRVSSYEIVEKMENTKLVLSTMTWFKDGTHDRVFNGMLAGAMTCTDTSIYMEREFVNCEFEGTSEKLNLLNSDNAELLMFSLEEIDKLPEKVSYLFKDMDAMQHIADRGRKKALEAHSWEARALELHQDLLTYLS